jgi:multidrug efflux system membrane fusion protein
MNPRFHPYAVSALLLGVVAAAGCRPQAAPPAAPPPPAVTVAPPEVRDLVQQEEITGRLEAVESVEIRPRVSGYLTEIRFQAGQLVEAGDVLFVIDPRPKRAAFERADAEFKRAQVRLENAEREAQRAEALLKDNALSLEEIDQRRWAYQDAQAAVQSAAAARETARLDLDFCEVKAPVAGRVGRALVTLGNNVSGADGFTTLLATLVSVDPVYAYADLDEATYLRFSELVRARKLADAQGRIPVEMALGNSAGFAHRGHVESLDNRLDPGTGSMVVRTVFPNPDGALVPGLFARLRLPAGAPERALLVPEAAIGTDQNQKFVLTLTSSNTVAYRPVVLGRAVDGRRVVREGLSAEDQVVVNGLMRVRPGMPVTPQKAEPPVQTASR